MNTDFNRWLVDYITWLGHYYSGVQRKDLSMRFPINPKEIGREVVERMSFRVAGYSSFGDNCIRLEPRR